MTNNSRKAFVRNVVTNWLGMVLNVLVAFILTPFVIHELGTSAYGFWAVLQSLLAYTFLLDFGVRSSLNRHLAKFYAQGDQLEANRIFNTGMMVYLAVCLVVISLSCLLGLASQRAFSFHELDSTTTFLVVVLVGASVALQFPAGVLDAVLTALQRFDLMNIAQVLSLFARTTLLIVFLKAGYGLLGLSVATFLGSLVNLLLNWVFAVRICPTIRFKLSMGGVNTIKLLANHSFYAFMLIGATRIITDTGNIIIGVFVGTAAVAFYAIAGSLTTYATNVISGISTTIPPAASHLEVKGDQEGLKILCIGGTKYILLSGLPILLTFILSGETFIKLWVGEGFSGSYPPLVLLSLAWAFNYLQSAAACILMGISRQKVAAWLVLAQSLLNLGLSLYLVQSNGMLGVAWANMITSVVMNLAFQAHALHVLGIATGRFVVQALLPTGVALLPFVAVLEVLFVFSPPTGLLTYFLHVALASCCMLACLPWLGLSQGERDWLWRILIHRMKLAGVAIP